MYQKQNTRNAINEIILCYGQHKHKQQQFFVNSLDNYKKMYNHYEPTDFMSNAEKWHSDKGEPYLKRKDLNLSRVQIIVSLINQDQLP